MNNGNPTLRWIFWILALIVLVIAISSGIKKHREEKKEKQKTEIQKGKTESLAKAKVTTLPAVYTEYHFLKKDTVIRVTIPFGYKCDYYGGGKKYYHQAQNSEKEIWGGSNCPTGLGNPNASYADIWCFNEEITVRCEFTKK